MHSGFRYCASEDRDSDSDEKRPPSVTRWGLSYALALRAIGQSLEAQQTKDFDLSTLETGFVVCENKPRYLTWRQGYGRGKEFRPALVAVPQLAKN